MAGYLVLDTNVVIGHLRGDLHNTLDEYAQRYILRHSAVVLSELYRGAQSRTVERVLDALVRAASEIWTPRSEDWLKAGRLGRSIGDEQGFDVHKRRELQNDCLIALTAYRHGAAVLTGDGDFRLIGKRVAVTIHEI